MLDTKGEETMPVYLISESKTRDAKAYAEYQALVPEVISKYGGRYIVRGGEITAGVGGWLPERILILEFDSKEDLRRCFASPEYKALAPLHDAGGEFRSIIAEGYTNE